MGLQIGPEKGSLLELSDNNGKLQFKSTFKPGTVVPGPGIFKIGLGPDHSYTQTVSSSLDALVSRLAEQDPP